MKIAFVMDDLSVSNNGTSATALRYAESLRSQGHEVRLIGYGATGPDSYPLPAHYVPLATEAGRISGFTFAQPSLELFNQAFDGVDVIHVFLPFKLGEFAHDWARKHHVPLTAAFHLQPENVSSFIHLESSRALNDYLYDLFDQWLYYDVRHIHCPSKMIAYELKKHGYTAELHVISNGIPDAFKPGPGRDFGDGLTHIVTVGRLAKEKNQKTIIEGVGLSKFADTLQLHICGEGPLRHELEEVGRKLPHPPIFEYHSESDLIALLRSCPLYIHASTADIEAISVIEAFACGCVPIIGKAPMSAPAQFALLDESVFPANDAQALADRIDWWLSDPSRIKQWKPRYAEEGRALHVENCTKQFAQMLERAIKDDTEAYRQKESSLTECIVEQTIDDEI